MFKIIFLVVFSISQAQAFEFSFSTLKKKFSEIQNKIIETGKVFGEQIAKMQEISTEVLTPREPTFRLSDAVDCPEDTGASVLPNFSKAQECDDLNVGQFKVNTSSLNSAHKYLLYKPEANKVEIFLNLNFTSNGVTSIDAPAMRSRVASCLGSLKGYLKSPEGEEMNIRLVDPTKKDKFIFPETTIKIAGANTRSNSESYEEDIDCPTIAHEVMHLFGLCDEYLEKEPPLDMLYSCRTVVPQATIMNSQARAFDESMAQSLECKCESEKCQKILMNYGSELPRFMTKSLAHTIPLEDVQRYNCDFNSNNYIVSEAEALSLEPISMKRVGDKIVFTQLDLWENQSGQVLPVKRTIACECAPDDVSCNERLSGYFKRYEKPHYSGNCHLFDGEVSRQYVEPSLEDQDRLVIQDQRIRIYKTPVNKKGLLYPNHYKKIFYGNCSQRLPNYNDCAANAYKSRGADGGLPGVDICTNVNPQCADPNFFIGER